MDIETNSTYKLVNAEKLGKHIGETVTLFGELDFHANELRTSSKSIIKVLALESLGESKWRSNYAEIRGEVIS